MKNYFSLLLLAFVVAAGSIITSLVLPNNSLLSPSPANAQQADIRNGYVWLTLPSTGNQNDSWSCGPNSAARVLAFYGHRVNYEQVRSVSQRDKGIVPPKVCIGSGILKKCANTSGFKTGFEPWELRDVINRWERGNAKYERGADLGKLKSLLSQGKPVLVLRRVGSFKPGRIFGTWPEMHWVAVHGFNEQAKKIYFTDTDGRTYEKSYDEFISEWDWRIGDGLASETFHRKGVKPKTMVWIDKSPPQPGLAFDERFRAVSDWAVTGGYISAFPTFHQADYGQGVVFGSIALKPGAAEPRDVLLTDLGNPRSNEELFRAVSDWSVRNGYISGFPNFHQRMTPAGVVFGVIALKPGAAELTHMPMRDLK